MPERIQLSDPERRVYEAVTTLESRGHVPFPSVIAEQAGMVEAEVEQPLRALADKNLLHREDTLLTGLDFGPRWFAVQPA